MQTIYNEDAIANELKMLKRYSLLALARRAYKSKRGPCLPFLSLIGAEFRRRRTA